MHRRFLFLIFPILLILSLLRAASPSFAQAGSAYVLVAAVNPVRATNGLGSLQADSALMSAAQVQSDYQASIGVANVPAAPGFQDVTPTPPGVSTPAPVEVIPPIQTSTPDAEGSIYHVVQPGENPVSIAEAYGIDLGTFLAQNDLIQNPLIFPGDTLIIRLAPTATPTIETTPTRIPTRTPRPTREATSTPTPAPTRTPTEIIPEASPTPQATGLWASGGLLNDPLLWAIGVLALAGVLLIVVGSVLKRGT